MLSDLKNTHHLGRNSGQHVSQGGQSQHKVLGTSPSDANKDQGVDGWGYAAKRQNQGYSPCLHMGALILATFFHILIFLKSIFIDPEEGRGR